MLLTSRIALNAGGRRASPANQENAPMHDSQGHRTITPARARQRMRPLALLAIGPLALGLLVTGCTAIEDTTDYIGDLFSQIEDGDEVIAADAVPGDDEPYRSLSEVPSEAPAISSEEERIRLTAGLVADREKAQHTAEELRARVEEEPMMQVRAVYQPAEE